MELMTARDRPAAAAMRQVVVVMPSAFTLGNLFFGFWAIVSAYNGNFRWAGWFIVFAGILDMLDGRVARLSKTGTRFGAELDSLVDIISFGVAPALIMYFLEFTHRGAVRLGPLLHLRRRGRAPAGPLQRGVGRQALGGWFTGMPSPAAGMTLAVLLPVQPDRLVPRVARVPGSAAPGARAAHAAARRADGEQREVPQDARASASAAAARPS